MFVREMVDASLKVWEVNVGNLEYGMSLWKPRMSCADITRKFSDPLRGP